MKTIAVIGSCDTKYKEIAFMREMIEAEGLNALVINIATGPDQSKGFDISREEVALSKGVTWEDMKPKTKGEKITFMAEAVAGLVEKLYREG
jgi:uncharacterized protein (UPF0261 family)